MGKIVRYERSKGEIPKRKSPVEVLGEVYFRVTHNFDVL